MKPLPSVVVAGAVGAVALLVLFSSLAQYRLTASLNDGDPDSYHLQQQKPRFAAAVAGIPIDAVVGYVSDLDPESIAGGAAFYGAQYGIAPRLLVPYTDEHAKGFVIGSFSTTAKMTGETARLTGSGELELVRDTGSGVVLFRKPGGGE